MFVWIAASSAAMTVWGAGRDFSVAILRGIGGAAAGGCASNGAGRDPRNPGKPVKNGLLADFRVEMDGRAEKGSVQNNSGNIYTVGFELCSY